MFIYVISHFLALNLSILNSYTDHFNGHYNLFHSICILCHFQGDCKQPKYGFDFINLAYNYWCESVFHIESGAKTEIMSVLNLLCCFFCHHGHFPNVCFCTSLPGQYCWWRRAWFLLFCLHWMKTSAVVALNTIEDRLQLWKR